MNFKDVGIQMHWIRLILLVKNRVVKLIGKLLLGGATYIF